MQSYLNKNALALRDYERIDEMYKKYGVKAKPLGCTSDDVLQDNTGFYVQACQDSCEDCTWYDSDEYYPPFTAETQLKLIKKIIDFKINIVLTQQNGEFSIFSYLFPTAGDKSFEIALVKFVITAYKFFTPSQRQEVKEILER